MTVRIGAVYELELPDQKATRWKVTAIGADGVFGTAGSAERVYMGTVEELEALEPLAADEPTQTAVETTEQEGWTRPKLPEATPKSFSDWKDVLGDMHGMLMSLVQIMKEFGVEYQKTICDHEDRADARQEAWSEKAEAAAEERNREQCAAMILQGYIVRHGMDKDSVELAVRAADQLRAELIRTRPVKTEGDEDAP
jgi:hypothetical protein